MEVVQSNKYYKSRAVGVISEVGLTTDPNLAEPTCLRNTTSFIPPRHRKSRGTSHYTTVSMHDNDPSHVSMPTHELFEHKRFTGKKVMEWPPSSSDLKD